MCVCAYISQTSIDVKKFAEEKKTTKNCNLMECHVIFHAGAFFTAQ